MDDRLFMLEAIALAKEAAEHGDVPVGAVVVKDGKIIGRGKNRREEQKTQLHTLRYLLSKRLVLQVAIGDFRDASSM